MKTKEEIINFCSTWFNWDKSEVDDNIVNAESFGFIEFTSGYLSGDFILALVNFVQAGKWAITINYQTQNISLCWRLE